MAIYLTYYGIISSNANVYIWPSLSMRDMLLYLRLYTTKYFIIYIQSNLIYIDEKIDCK